MADSVAVQMQNVLEEYSREVENVAERAIKDTANASAKKLKSTSPKMTGDYAKGWRVKRLGDKDVVVHNATNYQLTHLLENGHIIRNKKGEYGRAPAHPHIKDVEQWAISEFENQIEKGLQQ